MEFWIQASKPRNNGVFSAADVSLADAIETVFSLNTESAFIVWKNVYIPLLYKYDFSCIIEDLMKLLVQIQSEDTGNLKAEWPSSGFHAKWHLFWQADSMQIESQWIMVGGGLTESLNRIGPITLKKSEFLAEWLMPLKNILEALKDSGYNNVNLKEIESLEGLVLALPDGGYLYKQK